MYDFHSPKQKTAIGSQETEPRPSNIIQIGQNLLETRLDRLVAEKVAELLNAMLDAEADEIANAAKYERTGERKAYRAGHYDRSLTAKAGRLALKVPKLKGAVFESAVIERYRRREESVEEALIDMYLAGVSTRQVDDISQLLWGDRMPSQTLSDKLKKVYGEIEAWRTRPLEDEYPYVFMDGVRHKRSWGGHVENVSVLVAIGVNAEGHREVIGVAEGMKEDRDSWEQFVRSMIERGLKGVRLVVGDRCAGLVATVGSMLPKARYQRCMARFMRDVLSKTPPTHRECVRRPQGHIRHGIPGIRPGQGRTGRHGDGIQEAQGRRELPARGRRRDDDLPAGRVPGRAPQEDPHEQHDRAAGQGDPPAHARGGRLPRREQRVDAHMRPHPSRHRERMVDPPLSRHVPAR